MKVLSVLGARPQFIKAAPVGQALKAAGHIHVLVHTGQHYDYVMSKVFFDELGVAKPDYNLDVRSATHGRQTAQILIGIEQVLLKEQPDCVLVYGDTNSTLAAALGGAKLHIPVGHVEAGERNFTPSFKMVHPSSIPEETNRVVTDHVSTLLFCATRRAVDNLRREGVEAGVYEVGDVSLDTFLQMSHIAATRSTIVRDLALTRGQYLLATVHRAVNTDQQHRLRAIVSALLGLDTPVVFPVHPRTRKALDEYDLHQHLVQSRTIRSLQPVGYFDMLQLETNARAIITDSGGVIREAYFVGVPSVIVDDTTEWIDLVREGWGSVVGANTEAIKQAVGKAVPPSRQEALLGCGDASRRIVNYLEEWARA